MDELRKASNYVNHLSGGAAANRTPGRPTDEPDATAVSAGPWAGGRMETFPTPARSMASTGEGPGEAAPDGKDGTDGHHPLRERMDADLKEFAWVWPEVYRKANSDPKVLPQSVWDDVGRGHTLTAAFAKYEAARLGVELNDARNRSRSTGSMISEGGTLQEARDAFSSGLNE